MDAFQPGDVIGGRYRIDRVLGRGGMGVVVAATHLELEQPVAIKFVLPEFLENQEAVARFLREGKSAVKIRSEHVARVLDVGRLDSGAPYLVMEYLEGCDLSARIRHGPMPILDAIGAILHACEALAEAHSQGMVHRDIKPANLFLTTRADGSPCIKVLDFGISKVKSTSTTGLTRGTGVILGSVLYMSPEQLHSSKDVDARGDIWALGVTLYELLTTHNPFYADDLPELILKIVMQPPTPLRSFRPDVPEALEAVIMRCLEKDRARRIPNVAELAHQLEPWTAPRERVTADRTSKILGHVPMAPMPAEPAAPTVASTMFMDARTAPGLHTGSAIGRLHTGPAIGVTQAAEPVRIRKPTGVYFMAAGVGAVVAALVGLTLYLRDPSPAPAAVARPVPSVDSGAVLTQSEATTPSPSARLLPLAPVPLPAVETGAPPAPPPTARPQAPARPVVTVQQAPVAAPRPRPPTPSPTNPNDIF